ncbi:40S ribosomal protein S3a [Tupaia chinensis]|uniref:40S ribosomal protein S3a n=1 Tax=Tupaia chinensis TaxID=246437 RepID=L9L2D6_TUPCH|nr:40S ribosomal protein S3a [Tupaia chinensis]
MKALAMFNIRNIGKTLVTRNQGTKIVSDGLKGRVFEVSLTDLQEDKVAFRKFKLITEDVQGKNCLTNFHGMDLTHDKKCSMFNKWQTILKHMSMSRLPMGICFVPSVLSLPKNTSDEKDLLCPASAGSPNPKKMMEIMTREEQTNDLKEVVNKLILDSIGKDIEKACQSIYLLHDVFVRKKIRKDEVPATKELHLMVTEGVRAQMKVEQSPQVLILQEGRNSFLTCNYSSTMTGMQWFQQSPGGRLISLFYIASGTKHNGRLKCTVNTKERYSQLHISDAQPEDSASYFCAVETQCFAATCCLCTK